MEWHEFAFLVYIYENANQIGRFETLTKTETEHTIWLQLPSLLAQL